MPEFTEEELAAHDREVAAKAWDEGYKRSERDEFDVVYTPNPYRIDDGDGCG